MAQVFNIFEEWDKGANAATLRAAAFNENGPGSQPLTVISSGAFLIISDGEYDGHCIAGVCRVLRDINVHEVWREFLSSSVSRIDYLKFMIDRGYVEDLRYGEWNT